LPPPPLTGNEVTLYLHNGDWVTGELLRETADEFVLKWEYGEATFKRQEILQMVRGPQAAAPDQRAAETTPTVAAVSAAPVTLHLKNGGVVSGTLAHETPQAVILVLEEGEVGFQRGEIERMIKGASPAGDALAMPWEGAHRKAQWPYRSDIVVKLKKGTVVDAPLTAVSPTGLLLSQRLENGGQVEQTIARTDVEHLLFKPVRNARSDEIETQLKELFPSMSWHEEGAFTIVTDSPGPAVKEYRRTVRELATDWYLTFFPLVKDQTPHVQHYIVVFENFDTYIEYAAADGVPGWLAVGYFHPDDQVLYCFNTLGEKFSELLYDAFLGQFRGARDRIAAQVKGTQYELTVEGQISEFLQKLESAHSTLRQSYGQMGEDILRHELTHSLFHSRGLQNIVLSRMSDDGGETVKKKRQYLQATDTSEKRRLLEELLRQQSTDALPEIQAANSWVVEGLAGYMEPWPVGEPNLERLAEIQEAKGKQQVLPLEFLNAFQIGSFRGMATQSKLYAYAQSWALCHFLMQRHPEAFLAYQERLAREQPKDGEDTLAWLLEALGISDLRALEAEFDAHLSQFPKEDPAWLKQWQFFIDLERELSALAARLWG